MLDAFKQLVESGIINEDIKTQIEAAYTQKIQENREQVTAELREEFAQKYSHDRKVMVEAIDRMLGERLSAELAELRQDQQSLVEARAEYHKKMSKDAKMMETFVMAQLGKELKEFQSDRQMVSERFQKLEDFVVHALAKEIKEFAQDKRDLAEAKVKLVREAKTKFNAIRREFISRSARIVESTVTKSLTKEISQLKEDIDSSRHNQFGRRLFEAFAQEYANSYLNEKSETSKLLKVIQQKEIAISEAKQALNAQQKLVESKEREIRVTNDRLQRREIMSELLAPLSADKKELMSGLLESVQTPKLAQAFDKYLPAVMENGIAAPRQQERTQLNEGVVTGNRDNKPQPTGSVDNILDIRKLAGLK